MTSDRSGQVLSWDTEFFRTTVARLMPHGVEALADDDRWCRETGVAVAYLLVPAADIGLVLAAQQRGFGVVDVRLVFGCETSASRPALDTTRPQPQIDAARAEDLPALGRIASTAHRDSRFYADPRFPTERCDALYEAWIRGAVERDDVDVFVARVRGEVGGYVAVKSSGREPAVIELIAVTPDARGRGVGPRLLERGIESAGRAGAARVEVATQARNVAAQRLYQRGGMISDSAAIWLHKWYSTTDGDSFRRDS